VTKEAAKRGARTHLGLFSNPGGASHAFLYSLFVVPSEYGNRIVVWNIANGLEEEHRFIVRTYELPTWTRPDGSVGSMRDATTDEVSAFLVPWAEELDIEIDPENELAVAFVPAFSTDNPHIDVSYKKMLNTLPEMRRRQLRDGDWDVFSGQFFSEFSRAVHVVDPFDVPETWTKARGVDFGSTAPWAMVFGAWDENGDCWIYDECYRPGLTPKEQAAQAKAKEVRQQRDGTTVRHRFNATVADPSVFSNHRGAGKTIADMWREAGLSVTPAKNARVAGWQNVRQYLWDSQRPNVDGTVGAPRLHIMSNCTNLIRCFPLQMVDESNVEDLDTDLEDHILDALRYLLYWRPLGVRERVKNLGMGLNDRFKKRVEKMGKARGKQPAEWWTLQGQPEET
jgi:hypothetical protein